jgi:hypothetical protein
VEAVLMELIESCLRDLLALGGPCHGMPPRFAC